MLLRDIPIRRKLMAIILLTSGAVVLLTCALFFAYEILTFRQTMIRNLSTLGEVIAANSTAALAFDNQDDANEVLAALQAERSVVAACLYGADGKQFAKYPTTMADEALPAMPGKDGYGFERSHLAGFQPVVERGKRLGTLYLKSDNRRMYERFRLYAGIVVLVVIVSSLVAYALSRRLQQQISMPILALAETARAISERHDYSTRATKLGGGELGLLTDAFNQMLTQIQEQNMESKQAEARLRDSEQRYRFIFESSPLPKWAFDAETLSFLAVNDAAVRHYGYSQDEFLAMTIKDIRPPEDIPALMDNISRTTEGLDDTTQWRHRKKDGGLIDVEITSHDLMWLGRRASLVLINDITERKRAENEILQLNVELEERVRRRTADLEAANKELESFSYSVSHDLRAPLRHIEGYVELVVRHAGETLDEKSRGHLQTVSESVAEMGQLIDDLLDFSRMGQVEMQQTTIDLDQLVGETIAGLEREIHGRDIVWKRGPLPPVQADVALMKQVFVNLISNAVKYTRPRDPAEIEIGCAREENGEAVLFVRDNGVGFDMKYADKLFGVFQRLHHADEFEGTGVGLANVQRIIARHGGRIWAEAALNGGATFFFTLTKSPNRRKEEP